MTIANLRLGLILLFCISATPLISQNTSSTASLSIQSSSEADSLLKLGNQYLDKAEYLKAKPIFEALLPYFEEKEAVIKSAEVLMGLSELHAVFNDWSRCVEACERGIEQLENVEGAESKVALFLGKMGLTQGALGQYEKGEQNIQKGIELEKSHGSESSITLAKLYGTLGLFNLRIGRFEKSLAYFDQCIEMNNALGIPNAKSNVSARLNKITINRLLRKNIEAFSECQAVLAICEGKEQYREFWPKIYQSLGTIYLDWQELEKALFYLEKAETEGEKLWGTKVMNIAVLKVNLAATYSVLDQQEATIEKYSEARDILLELSSGQQIISVTYEGLGRAYEALGDYQKSFENAQLAVKVYENLPNGNQLQYANALRLLGYAYVYLEQPKEAMLQYKKAIQILEENYGSDNAHLKPLLTAVGGYYLELGNYEEALRYIKKGWVFLCGTVPDFEDPDFLNCLDQYTEFADISQDMPILLWHAAILIDKADANPTDWKNLQSALQIYDKGIQLLALRNKKLDTETTAVIIGSLLILTRSAVEVSYKLYQKTQAAEYLEAAFSYADIGKGVLLQEAKEAAKSEAFYIGADSTMQQKQALEAEIHQLEKKLAEAKIADEVTSVVHIRDELLFPLKLEYEELQKSIKASIPKNKNDFSNWEKTSIKEIQEHLSEETLFIEYAIHDHEGGKNDIYILCASSDGELNIREVAIEANISEQIYQFQKLLQSHNLVRADRRRKFIQLSHAIYQQFIQPIEDQLQGKNKIVIIGEGMTNYVPFDVLLSSSADKAYQELDFMVKDFEISYHYSANLFLQLQQKKPDYGNDLLAFAPVFQKEGDETLAYLETNRTFFPDSVFRSLKDGKFQPLLYSKQEVETISNLFGESQNTILLHANANEVNLKKALQENHRFVHIASHSFANIDYPKFSGVACSIPNEEESEDGILHVGEIYNLTINSDLVVLSSCESGMGKLLKGEGMLGLNRSFVYAGASNVVFSLWEVEDKATSEMMQYFYKEILKDKSYSSALRNAKLKMLENKMTASPDVWGAFLLVGR